jgi:hypothetical protein
MDTNIYIACLRQVVEFAPVVKCDAYGVTVMNGRRDGWMGGFAKVDNRFENEKWIQGGCKGCFH